MEKSYKKVEVEKPVTYNQVSIGLCRKKGDINYYIVNIPFNAETGEVGEAVFTEAGQDLALGMERFKVSVIENKLFNVE